MNSNLSNPTPSESNISTDKKWWKESIIYQIYPRSFNDSNGDGIGDLRGIIEKLPYLKDLGINLIWMSPIFASPNADNGYDISDYKEIMTEFGTMPDFDELLEKAHALGIKMILDIVLGHTSDQHEWFQAAKSSKDDPKRDYYFWRDAKDGGPPNNYPSIFSGSAWEWEPNTEQYYLHLFLKEQPDTNWENPKLRQEFFDIIHFWMGKGIDGFRLDVIPMISKRIEFVDTPYDNVLETINNVYANGPRLHEFLHMLHKEVWSKYDCFTMGEGVGISPSEASDFVSESRQELHTFYHFDHFYIDADPKKDRYEPIPVDYKKFKDVFFQWDTGIADDAWNIVYLGNHDLGRMVNRFGSPAYRELSAKLLNSILLTQRGTPILYMGDELGMVNREFTKIEQIDDVQTVNAYYAYIDRGGQHEVFMNGANLLCRDHARTPMHWSNRQNGGFSEGNTWIPMNPNFTEINVEDQVGKIGSVWEYCKMLISLRKSDSTWIYGQMKELDFGIDEVFAYNRMGPGYHYCILHNMQDQIVKLPLDISNAQILLNNYDEITDLNGSIELNAWQSIILKF